jgi:aspartate/methionine/tyrosine aminotransferase
LRGGSQGVLALHSLSKRSNMAGLRAGFVAGDPELVHYLGEVRKHAGLMVPGPVQAAAVAALGDDDHVVVQRERYDRRRAALLPAFEAIGLRHAGGPSTFYLWLAADDGADGWEIAERLVTYGLVCAPGDLYGPDGAPYARVSLTIPDDAVDRLATLLMRR